MPYNIRSIRGQTIFCKGSRAGCVETARPRAAGRRRPGSNSEIPQAAHLPPQRQTNGRQRRGYNISVFRLRELPTTKFVVARTQRPTRETCMLPRSGHGVTMYPFNESREAKPHPCYPWLKSPALATASASINVGAASVPRSSGRKGPSHISQKERSAGRINASRRRFLWGRVVSGVTSLRQ